MVLAISDFKYMYIYIKYTRVCVNDNKLTVLTGMMVRIRWIYRENRNRKPSIFRISCFFFRFQYFPNENKSLEPERIVEAWRLSDELKKDFRHWLHHDRSSYEEFDEVRSDCSHRGADVTETFDTAVQGATAVTLES